MAIDFYELGRKTGATTPKNQQSGFEAFVSGATKPLEDMLTASKATTAALTAAMPAGVPIEKVPEELRSQVTNFLTENKKSYTDATKVIASGINPQSDRYKNAVETINKVQVRFGNLSDNLEDVATKRKQALDDPTFSPSTLGVDALTFENLQNGSLYSSMSLNEDGTFNYIDGENNSKAWSDFSISKQNFTGQQAYLGAVKEIKDYKIKNKNASWNDISGTYENTFALLFNKLGPKGGADFAFADDKFLETKFKDKNINELKKNSAEVIGEYKNYVMEQLKKEYDSSTSFQSDFEKPEIFGAYRTKRDIDLMNEDISDQISFIGFDDREYKFKDGNYYDMSDDPDMTKPMTQDQVRRNNKIHGFYFGSDKKNEKPKKTKNRELDIVTGTNINYEFFGDTAANAYTKFKDAMRNPDFPQNVKFSKVLKSGYLSSGYKDVIEVFTTQGQSITVSMSNPDENSQRSAMRQVNQFINRYGDKPKVK